MAETKYINLASELERLYQSLTTLEIIDSTDKDSPVPVFANWTYTDTIFEYCDKLMSYPGISEILIELLDNNLIKSSDVVDFLIIYLYKNEKLFNFTDDYIPSQINEKIRKKCLLEANIKKQIDVISKLDEEQGEFFQPQFELLSSGATEMPFSSLAHRIITDRLLNTQSYSDIPYLDVNTGIIHIKNHQVLISRNLHTIQFELARRLLKNPKRVWFIVDLHSSLNGEAQGRLSQRDWQAIYNASEQINKKISAVTKSGKFIKVTSKVISINLAYL